MRQRKKGTHDRFSPNKAKQESSPLSSEVVDPVEEDEEDKDVLPEPWPRLVIAQKTDLIVGAVVFLISLVVFTLTLCPSVPGGDAGELITCACNAGIPHPPGYPTLLILGRFVLTILPFGTPAWKMHFLSAVCSATAALFIYFTALDMTRASRAAAGTAALSWAFSPLIWEYSVTAEVFSLNNCMTSIFLFIYGRYCLEREKEAACGVGDSWHLMINNHVTDEATKHVKNDANDDCCNPDGQKCNSICNTGHFDLHKMSELFPRIIRQNIGGKCNDCCHDNR